MIKPILYSLIIISLISTFACNDPATINTDLVDISLLDVFSEDDFDLTAWTATEDSVIAFQPSFFILNQYPFGIYQDLSLIHI